MHGGRRGGVRDRRAAMIGLAVLSLLATACGDDSEDGTRDVPEMTQGVTTVQEPKGAANEPGSDGRTVRIVLRVDSDESEGAIDAMVDGLRRRLDAVGVEAPEFSPEGERLLLVVHGLTPTQQASVVRLVGRAGIVRLRPVLSSTINAGSEQVEPSITDPEASVALPSTDGTLLYTLGPAGADGTIFKSDASAVIQNGAWIVTVGLRPAADGEDLWNALAAQCYSAVDTCPAQADDGRGQLAIEVDGVIISAPTVQSPEFADEVSISGQFSEDEAQELAGFLRSGALPAVTVESITTD